MKNIDFKTFDEKFPGVLDELLHDWTTGEHIMWMTEPPVGEDHDDFHDLHDQAHEDHHDEYLVQGEIHKETGACPTDKIQVEDLTSGRIIPRNVKAQEIQKSRTAYAAEVFTPPFACAEQNEFKDKCWLEPNNKTPREEIIFTKLLPNRTWITNSDENINLIFSEDSLWMKYIKSNIMESCCGEGPYMCSPYDTTTGEYIELSKRIGMFDRKMKLVNLFCNDMKSWLIWSREALMHSYAYEWQGDNLILARFNMLSSYYEYLIDRFPEISNNPNVGELLKQMAIIISKNMVQMDGMSWCIPMSCSKNCEGCRTNEPRRHDGVYVRIFWWDDQEWQYFKDYAKSSGAQDVYELF